MSFNQTKEHRKGRGSYSQVGLVRGQFGAVVDGPDQPDFLAFLDEKGFDGYELDSWAVDLSRCDTEEGANALAKELVANAAKRNLEIFSVSAHLQGQALGDEPSAKTLQFVGGKAVGMYKDWRHAGNEPPREDPFYVPEDVGRQIHLQAEQDLIRAVRLAHYLGKLQDREVVLTGFVGDPAYGWSHWFKFPPLPDEIGGYAIPNVRQVSGELLIERFTPVFNACKELGVKFGLECHPSEWAIGDIASAREFIALITEAGYAGVVGFNLDASHMEWQGVSVIAFIREFSTHLYAVHIKGVQVIDGYTVNGLLGGHQPMGDPDNGWNFTTAGSGRDSVDLEAMLVELKRVGFDGAVSIEWEDNDAQCFAGAELALKKVREADLPPSDMAHDEALKAED